MEEYNIDLKIINPAQSPNTDVAPAGFEPGDPDNKISSVSVTDEQGNTITKAAPGQKIKVRASAFVRGGSIAVPWRACITVREVSSQPDRFKNSFGQNVWYSSDWDVKDVVLDEYPDGSTVMPARNMNLIFRLWARGDRNRDWPPEEDW